MRIVIVYESMYGNTHVVADAIGAGLESAADVIVVPVSKAYPELLHDAALVVVGGPTHVHGMSRATTRKGTTRMRRRPCVQRSTWPAGPRRSMKPSAASTRPSRCSKPVVPRPGCHTLT
jgi:hypothetical protein